jgi:hypothetical protein
MNATQLLQVASKVLENQEHEEKWKADKGMKAKVSLLAAALRKPDPTKQPAPPWKGRPNGRTLLQLDQCTYCKEIGHWKNECPHCKGPASQPNKITPGKKTGWQPEPEAQDSLA